MKITPEFILSFFFLSFLPFLSLLFHLFLSLQVTLISAFVFPHLPPKPMNIFFAFCISLSCVSAGILVSTAFMFAKIKQILLRLGEQ